MIKQNDILRFSKWEGLGNDFVLIDRVTDRGPPPRCGPRARPV
jgi:hypothetical protein